MAVKRIGWSIERAAVTVPSQSGALTYNGTALTPGWTGYDSAKMTIGGTVNATNEGTYNASFTPAANCKWNDGSTAAKTVPWAIGKAAGSMALSESAVTLNASNLTASVTVTRLGDGAISAISSNTGVALVSVSGNIMTISQVNQTKGTATITVKVGAGTNYTVPTDKTVSVTAQFLPAKKALNDCTWEETRRVSDAGKGSEYWNVGDRKAVLVKGTIGTLSINQTLYVYILGFDHNRTVEGSGIQFGAFKTALSGGKDICLVDGNYSSRKTDGTKMFNSK